VKSTRTRPGTPTSKAPWEQRRWLARRTPAPTSVPATGGSLKLAADTGLTMLVYTAEPGSSSADALTLLASWAATPEQTALTPAPKRP
jgi:hypothetical protein